MVELLAKMVNDPDEAWWGVREALQGLGKASAEQVGPHADRIVSFLKHDEWWIRKAAITDLTPIASHKDYYKSVLPAIGAAISIEQRPGVNTPLGDIVKNLSAAEPAIQQLGLKVFAQTYLNFPALISAPGGQNMAEPTEHLVRQHATNVAYSPKGFDKLYKIAPERYPQEISPHLPLTFLSIWMQIPTSLAPT